MTFDEIAGALSALGKAVEDRGGDRSAIAATEVFLRAEADSKPAAFQKAAKKVVKAGLRLPRATEVRAGAAAQSLSALLEVLEALGIKDASRKAVKGIRDVFEDEAQASLAALSEALEKDRVAAKERAAKTTPRASAKSAKAAP